MVIPGWMLPHTVSIEAYLGDGPYGPHYAAPVSARAYVEDTVETVRDERGEEVVSSTRVWLHPSQECAPESRMITPSGRVQSVVTSSLLVFPGTPSHREVRLR
ncbi:hypothetical protein ACGFYY_25375 [Streptomyces sp. NPDC048331]|uniref:hypothetical protein n=1 Tax=Streptomyces sp. NPDC048331 TaxID=3365534 RepID=UPI00371C7F41